MVNSYQSNVLEKPRGGLTAYRRFKRRGKIKRLTKEAIAQIKFDETLKIIDWGNSEPIETTTYRLAA